MFIGRMKRARLARTAGRDSRRASFAEALERRIVLAGGPLDPSVHLEVIASALPGYLNVAQSKLTPILDHPLPIVGRQLDGPVKFYTDFAGRVNAVFSAAHTTVDQIQADINAAFGPAGLNALQGSTAVYTPASGTATQVQFNVDLQKVTTVQATAADALAFDIGVPALGLSVPDAKVTLTYTYTVHLRFGVNGTGFYVDTASASGADPEVKLAVAAETPGWRDPNQPIEAHLGFLSVKANDYSVSFPAAQPARPTGLHGTFLIDTVEPSGDGKLYSNEFGASVQNAALDPNASAQVNLHARVELGVDAHFPKLAADFNFDWPLGNAVVRPGEGIATFGAVPAVQFDNIRIDLSSFFNDLVGPVLDDLNAFLGPIKPVIDVLTEPLPLLSDIAPLRVIFDSNHDDEVTLAEVIKVYEPDVDLTMLEALRVIEDLSIPAAAAGDVRMGKFTIAADVRPLVNLLTVPINAAPASPVLDPASQDFLDKGDGAGLAFPLLSDPTQAFNLLLGKDADFVKFRSPVLDAGFTMSQYIPIVGFFGIRLEGRFSVRAQMTLGYDTYGFRKWAEAGLDPDQSNLVYDGLYIDRAGTSVALSAGVFALADVNFGFVEVGVGGGIIGTITLRPHDLPDPVTGVVDGKVRYNEIIEDLNMGPLCMFDYSGSLDFGLTVYFSVGIWPAQISFSYDIVQVRLLDFDFDCAGESDAPVLAQFDPTLGPHTLVLNTGPNSARRATGDMGPFTRDFYSIDQADDYTVRSIGPNQDDPTLEDVTVNAFGFTQIYRGVSVIEAEGGAGDDRIRLAGTHSTARLWGGWKDGRAGSGNDKLYGGNGPSTVRGGDGDDELTGNALKDVYLYGEAGNDLLHGKSGADWLDGGEGDDKLFGNGNDDFLFGGPGNDLLDGGDADDHLYGGTGNDDLRAGAGPGNDTLFGEDGDDILRGGIGDVSAFGGSGADRIQTYGGVDFIDPGGVGAGNPGVDQVLAGKGDDFIRVTNDGNANINGEEGDDVVTQYANGSQALTNGLLLGRGNSTLANVERANLVGGGGDDRFDVSGWYLAPVMVDGLGGTDTVVSSNPAGPGGRGTDFVLADSNLARSDGGAFNLASVERAELTGGSFDDSFDVSRWTGAGSLAGGAGGTDRVTSVSPAAQTLTDAALARSGRGTLGLAGVDRVTLVGGPGNDNLNAAGFFGTVSLYGLGGDDTLVGGHGADYLHGGTGTNTLDGQDGDDVLYNGAASAGTLDGGAGMDTITGSPGRDVVSGGADDDLIFGMAGDDVLRGGAGDDTILGGAGNDLVSGDGGADTLAGGRGDDAVYGHTADGLGDDNAADTLYANNASGGGDPAAAADKLYGQGGNDLLFGEGDASVLDGGAGPSNLVSASPGPGVGADATDFAPPPPADDPFALENAIPAAALTQLPDYRGRWSDLGTPLLPPGADPFAALGLGGSPTAAAAPAIAAGAGGVQYVAWADNRSGNWEIYVARHTAAGWQELAGSAHGGGVSGTTTDSTDPALTIGADGTPIVAWTELTAAGVPDVRAARFDPNAAVGGGGAWVAVGTSLSAGGVSNTGKASKPKIVNTSAGPLVAWLDRTGGAANVYAKLFNGSAWVAAGAGATSGSGVSRSTAGLFDFAIATDGTKVAVTWNAADTGRNQVYLRELTGGAAGTWNELAASGSGAGISNTLAHSNRPTVAYLLGAPGPFVAWTVELADGNEIYAATFDGTRWAPAGPAGATPADEGAASGHGVSDSFRDATTPILAGAGSNLWLVWQENLSPGAPGWNTALYARKWDGTRFVEQLPGESSLDGITANYSSVGKVSAAIDPAGGIFIARDDRSTGRSQVHVLGNTVPLGTVYYVNDDPPPPPHQTGVTTPITEDTELVHRNTFGFSIGRPENDGLSRSTPKPSVQHVLDAYTLVPGDVVMVDSGNYRGAGFTVTSADNGFTVTGPADGTAVYKGSTLTVDGASGVTLRFLVTETRTVFTVAGGAIITPSWVSAVNANNLSLYGNRFASAGAHVEGGSGLQVVDNDLRWDYAKVDVYPSTRFNRAALDVGGPDAGTRAGAAAALVRTNRLTGFGGDPPAAGMVINRPSGGVVTANVVSGGLAVRAAFDGRIDHNDLSGGAATFNFDGTLIPWGALLYAAPAFVYANRIHGSAQGMTVLVTDPAVMPGYYGPNVPNEIFDNAVGMRLADPAARVRNQHFFANAAALTGSGTVGDGAGTFDLANRFEHNAVALKDFAGTVQWNRFTDNDVAVWGGVAGKTTRVVHNYFGHNRQAAVRTGAGDLRVADNVMVSDAGDNVQVRNAAGATAEFVDNISWAEGGASLSADALGRDGFFADYNTYYAGRSAAPVVHWMKDFGDLFDYQQEVHGTDLHSIGTTTVNPHGARPRFVNVIGDDVRLFDLPTVLRRTAPGVDAAAPFGDVTTPASWQNLLTNASFESGTGGWTVNPLGTAQASGPAAYDGTKYYVPGNVALAFAEQTANLLTAGFTAAQLDAGNLVAVFGGRVRVADEDPTELGKLVLTFLDAAGNPVSGSPATTAPGTNTVDRWELLGGRAHVPAGARYARYRFESLRQNGAGANNDGFLDKAALYLLPDTVAPDQGIYGNTPSDTDRPQTRIRLISPDLYEDRDLSTPRDIVWQTYHNVTPAGPSLVRIDLYEDTPDGPRLRKTITPGTPDTGSYAWNPLLSDPTLTAGTYKLRIQVSLASDPIFQDRSSETFVIPEAGNSYYVNDGATAGDAYTSAAGNNRATGKRPGLPKPLPTTLLRSYDLGPGDTVFLDTGDYPLFRTLTLGGNPALGAFGDDEGLTLAGPADRARVARLTALGFSKPAVVELNAADFTVLKNLTITGGQFSLLVRNASTNLDASYLTVGNADLDGVRLEADSAGAKLDHLSSSLNRRDGISVGGPIASLTNSDSSGNTNAGINFASAGNSVLTGNESFLNKYGLLISNAIAGTTTAVGNADLSLGLGNRIHDNSNTGVVASGGVLLAGNSVYKTTTAGSGPTRTTLSRTQFAAPTPRPRSMQDGTYSYRITAVIGGAETLASPGQAVNVPFDPDPNPKLYWVNVAWDAVPGAGVYRVYRGSAGNERLLAEVAGTSFIDKNEVFVGSNMPAASGAGTGVRLSGGAQAVANVVHTNWTGIAIDGGIAKNNRVFGNADQGFYANSTTLDGNVVYGNALGVLAQVAPNSGSGPVIRNNVVYANALGGILLQGGRFPVIENNTVYQPAGDALRVEGGFGQGTQALTLRNNILSSQGPAPAATPPEARPPGERPTGFAVSIDPVSEGGLQSDYNLLYATGTGKVGLWENEAATTLRDWRNASVQDRTSLSRDPGLVDVDGADNLLGFTGFADHGSDDDFHEQSTGGSFHGGSLAPVLTSATGLPVYRATTLTNDALSSPALDRGDPASPLAAEPAPNGGFVNIGAFGNTAQASKSPASYVRVLTPDGGESALAGRTFDVVWRSNDNAGTVNIDLLRGASPATATLVQPVVAGAANNGRYTWSVPPALAPGNDYFVRVTRTGAGGATDTGDSAFGISSGVQLFYVNDGDGAAGDWTTTSGSDANDGLSTATPKRSIQSLLADYDLGPGDVIRVDSGNYVLTTNVVITHEDSGVTIQGFSIAGDATRKATLSRGAAAGAAAFDLRDADDVTFDRLTLTGTAAVGINAPYGDDSDRVTITNSDIYGFTDFCIYASRGNDAWTVANNRLHDTTGGFGGTGVQIEGPNEGAPNTVIRDNVVYNNRRIGIALVSGGPGSFIMGNDVHDNATGIQADHAAVSGNKVNHNSSVGMLIGGGATASGNTVSNSDGSSNGIGYGIQLAAGGVARGNAVFGNLWGIVGTGSIENNRVYNNTKAGIRADAGSPVKGNVVYANPVGIQGDGSPLWNNNLVYGNTEKGIWLYAGSAPQILNNTVVQTTGDALTIESTHFNLQFQNFRVRNNVLWAKAGYAIATGSDTATGFQSDYNNFYVTGTGKVGLWENVARPTLADWQNASLGDANSMSSNPLFVNEAAGDYHEQSTHGSFHGGSLAPVLDAATGLPAAAAMTEANDAVDSALIDSGDPASPFAAEPAPNGGFVNLGAFGNTAQASKSAPVYLRVTRPNGGESWAARQTFNVLWRSDNPNTGLVDIDLLHRAAGGALTLQANIATGTPNDGRLEWLIPDTIPAANDYVVRVTRQGGTSTSDLSDATFTIGAATSVYYVNDATVQAGDWTTTPGDDNNDGRTADKPKATVAALLAAYALGAGDVIRVDAGNYLLGGNIVLTPADSGVTIRGYSDAAFPDRRSVFNRGSTAASANVFQLAGADDVTVDRVAMAGAYTAIDADYGADSDRFTLSNSDVSGSAWYGIYAGGPTNEDWNLGGNRIHDNYVNLATDGARLNVTNNQIYKSSYGGGISLRNGNGSTVSGNEIYANNREGIAADNATVSNNVVHDNGGAGMVLYGGVLATGNTVYGQSARSSVGIFIQGAEVRGNAVYGNYDGITMSSGVAAGNRVFNNSNQGIYLSGGTARANVVYSNASGIVANYSPTILNNLSYANANVGIWVGIADNAIVSGNTVYQLTGDALRMELDPGNSRLHTSVVKNNILWAQGAGGYAFNVTNDTDAGLVSDYNNLYASGQAKVARWATHDFASRAEWTWELGLDAHGASADPRFTNPAGADGTLGYSGGAAGADFGADDDFSLRPGSPSIDAGDPASPYYEEPAPNGGRVNLGHQGNTSGATTSAAAQLVQVLSPNGAEKLQAGRPATVTWRSAGLTQTRTLRLTNAGGPAVASAAGEWAADAFAIAPVNVGSVVINPDTAGVSNPPPAEVYRTYTYANNGPGSSMGYRVPAPDGAYTIRLHWAEAFVGAGARKFDVKVNGVVVRADFDVFAAGGGYYKATSLSFPVTATGGTGIQIDLVNKTTNPAFLNAFEIAAINPGGVANPTADVQLSLDGGATWATIGAARPMDAAGRGSFTFTPDAASDNARVRVISRDGSPRIDVSDAPFQIAPAGRDFYVNDAASANDVFATAPGSNANHGKSPSSPMASVGAVLATYDLEPGDVIHVDAGSYDLFHDIVLLPEDSGVRVEGAGAATANPAAVSRLNRANTSRVVFDFRGADDVTIDRLALGGGAIGVYGASTADSDRVTISNNEIYAMSDYGVYSTFDNDDWTIAGNSVHDNIGGFARSSTGIAVDGNFRNAVISGNTVFNNPRNGISVYGNIANAAITGNVVYANGTGISTNLAAVTNNLAHHNTTGIYLEGNPPSAVGNVAHGNTDGIVVGNFNGGSPLVRGNRSFNNSNTGITGGVNATIRDNQVYSNRVGISGPAGFTGRILNNLAYSNTNQGILLNGPSAVRVVNNTVYQSAGDAVRVQGGSNVSLSNNLLWVEAGADVYVAADAQTGFKSDYNLLYRGPGPQAVTGFWGGSNRATLADWTAAGGQDAHSLAGNPLFVDVDGADNVLGYNVATGVDGGADDNFYVARGSPVIDHGASWTGPAGDLEGSARADDPATPNAGSPDYAVTTGPNQYAFAGNSIARFNNSYLSNYALPFAFPFYDGSYTTVTVSTEGFLQFAGPDFASNPSNNQAEFLRNRRVAPLWDNINVGTFTTTAEGVFADTSVAGQVKFTWKGVNEADGSPVNVSAVLFNDGRIRFDYGAGNSNLSPTVGISMGDGEHFLLVPGYSGAASLTGANSFQFGLVPGTVDVGAYEFRGRSDDVTPPTITATTPAAVGAGAQAPGDLRQIGLTFGEALNTPDARAAANYRLVGAGADGVLDTSDDVIYPLTPRFAQGASAVTLDVGGVANGRGLPGGTYRLTVFGGNLTAVHDLSSLPLDGDGNGTPGGDYVRVFTVGASDVAAPRVAAVWADGTGWSSGFRSFLQTTGIGNSVLGFAVPVGAAQTLALPWSNVNRFRVRFSEAVNVAQGDLKVLGVNVADYAIASFAYDPATFTATWTLAGSIKADKLALRLAGGVGGAGGIRDLAGNLLDGEWNNTAGAYPSGDGTPGGVFSMRLNVLPGDVTRDARVTAVDLLRARASVGRSTTIRGAGATAYSAFNDVNGDGRITATDVALIKARMLTRIPTADPTALPPALFGANPIDDGTTSAAASLLSGV